MKTAFLFPGHGAQHIGMGKDVAENFKEADEIFEQANDILGYDIARLCFEGPEEELNNTVNSQPAIFTVSAAMLKVFQTTGPGTEIQPVITAGLSLGEYTALYAAGTISFEDGLKLVQKRGQAMQAAADASEGSMVSVLGLDEGKVTDICENAAEGQLLRCANFNCPGQIVISGEKKACARAAVLAEEYGAIKAIPLKVAGAFHTDMMAPAAEALKKALCSCDVTDPDKIKTIANIKADYYNSATDIAEGLEKQLVQPILWQKCMEKLIADGVEEFYEIGPGRVLKGLMRKIDRKKKVTNINCAKNLLDAE